MQFRNFFFNNSGTDVFKTGDIPTQQTFEELFDSIPFFKELNDRAQLLKGGLAKTATDNNVNSRTNDDLAGGITMGTTTFVRPAQIPKVSAGSNKISVTTQKRVTNSNRCNEDSGDCINDYVIDLNTIIPEFTADVKVSTGGFISLINGGVPNLTVTSNTYTNGSSLQNWMNLMVAALNKTTQELFELNNLYKNEVPEIGSLNETLVEPSNWSNAWLLCDGSEQLTANYPVLSALLGNTFGPAAVGNFKLPDYRNKFLRGAGNAQTGVPSTMGGSDSASITLNVNNIPLHNHTFSGTTVTNGSHSHTINTFDNDNTGGGYPEAVDNSGTGNFASTEAAGNHNHTFSGTTDNTGNGAAFNVNTIPSFYPVYIRIKAR